MTTASGMTVCGKAFVDCSYEGDLLRMSGTAFTVGREPRSQFNESIAGRDGPTAADEAATPSFFAPTVSPFVEDILSPFDDTITATAINVTSGSSSSSSSSRVSKSLPANRTLLPTILSVYDGSDMGKGDDWVMSYCFRMCLTNNKSNRVPITAPEGYTPAALELLRRELRWATDNKRNLTMHDLFLIRDVGDGKIDLNSGQFSEDCPVCRRNGGYFPFSTDSPFLQHGWPLGNHTTRMEIFAQHVWWTKALLWYLGNDPELTKMQPKLVAEVSEFGLAGDEFVETRHWPPQLYVRESIRMKGGVIMTQHDVCNGNGYNPRSVGTSKWIVDVHGVQRVAMEINGSWVVVNGGGRDTARSHDSFCHAQIIEVPLDALTPKADDTSNLLVPVCASFSHVAFSAYRLEPQYAVFGHATGTAAALAASLSVAVQHINITQLQGILTSQKQILHEARPSPAPTLPSPGPIRLTRCEIQLVPSQQWQLQTDSTVRKMTSGTTAGNTCASVLGYSKAVDAPIWAANCHTSDKVAGHQNQEFVVVVGASGGMIQLKNAFSGLCLGASKGGTDLQQLSCSELNQTTWTISHAGHPNNHQVGAHGADREVLSLWELMDGRGLCATA
jgi:hypothetical protein